MDKTVAAVLGAITSLAVTQAHAAPAMPPSLDAAMQVSSYADLLTPIPNAVDLLATAPDPAADPVPEVQTVQYYHHHHHHWWRHHHHHHWWRYRRWLHHHWHYYR